MKIDSRYTCNLEYCGYIKPKYVVRFCGEWLDCFDSRSLALSFVNKHTSYRQSCLTDNKSVDSLYR